MTESGPRSSTNRGQATLVNLPGGVDLPESGILEGICREEPLSELNLLTVLYDTLPDDWIQAVAAYDDRPTNLGIVSVGDTYRATATQSSSPAASGPARDPERLELITPLSDPTDLHEVGLATTRYLDAWDDDEAQTIVLFDSVSSLLNGVDTEEAIQFLHIFRHRVTRTGATAFFIAHPGLHDPETMSMLRSLFDDVIENVGAESEVTADQLDDPMMDILNGPRRVIMAQLVREQSLTVAELAARTGEAGVADDPERLEIALQHTHLPLLANSGFVEYDREAETVELSGPVERVRPYLRLAAEEDQ